MTSKAAPLGARSAQWLLAIAAVALVVAGCEGCKKKDTAPDAGAEPTLDAGDTVDAGIAAVDPTEHPLVALSRCGECDNAPADRRPEHCAVCDKGWRCVRSLLAPKWALMEEASGYTLYTEEPGDAGAQARWRKEAVVEVIAETLEEPSRLDNLPEEAPFDLERHMTPQEGKCVAVEETPQLAVKAYFDDGTQTSKKPAIVGVKKTESYARVDVEAQGQRGFVFLRYDGEMCNGWSVESFGFAGCPARHPPYLPPAVIPTP
jgi:hypothetical protein